MKDNIYRAARMEAAKIDRRLANRERAAAAIYCSPEALCDYENGHTLPPCDIVQAMIETYGTPDLRGQHIRACCPLMDGYGNEDIWRRLRWGGLWPSAAPRRWRPPSQPSPVTAAFPRTNAQRRR